MVYRVVIVDDESYIADSTAILLESENEWEMEIQVFYSARQALKRIQGQKTDILIADIRMPEMDGLQLMDAVGRIWPMCQIILLTAHAQFDYVYQAIRQSSVDYVLKHDGYSALRAAVERAVARLNTSNLQQRLLMEAKAQAQAALPWLQREFFLELAHGVRYQAQDIARAREELNLPIDVEKPAYPLMLFIHQPAGSEALLERTQRMSAIALAAGSFLPQDARVATMQVDSRCLLWFWQFSEEISPAKLEGMLEGIQAMVQSQLDTVISFVYSAHGVDWTRYEQVFNRLSALMTMRVMGGEKMWLLCADLEPLLGGEHQRVARAARWISAYRADDPNAQEELEGLLDQLRSMDSVHDMAYMHLYLQIAMSLAQVIQEMGLSPSEQAGLMPHKLYDAKAHNTPPEAADYLRWLSRRLIDLRRESAQDSMKALVSHVKGYILQHYDEDVSLNKLAGFVHVNASYLSRVFKQNTGENLLEYIRRVRLDKAKELLEKPSLRIHEVSEMLGFQNPAYFSFYFKKNMGMTPREYRDSISNG